MACYSQNSPFPQAETPNSETNAAKVPHTLPAVLYKCDLCLLAFLVIVMVPQMQEMQYAGKAVFFYLPLAFVTFLLPCIVVFGWLTRHAPARIPVYMWILRLLDERWRSLIVVLVWWSGVLVIISTLGWCLSLLQQIFKGWLNSLPIECLVFMALLALVTSLACLPLKFLRYILWGSGLLVLAFLGLLGCAALVSVLHNHTLTGNLPPSSLNLMHTSGFSWSFCALAFLSMLGLNSPLFMDGEMRGTSRYLRRSSAYLWWGGLAVFLPLLLGTGALLILNPATPGALLPTLGHIFGSGAIKLCWFLLCAGYIGTTLANMLIFSRALLLAARQGYIPRWLTHLNRSGVPYRILLVQLALIVGGAAFLCMIVPALLKQYLPPGSLRDLITGDQFGLIASLSGSLWAILMFLMFAFALRIFLYKYRQHPSTHLYKPIFFTILCLSGGFGALVCMLAPLREDWPNLFFSSSHWFPLLLLSVVFALIIAWLIGELPRRSALLREKEKRFAREKLLREEIQRVYTRECDLHNKLREAYDEQQVSILQQKILLTEVNRLYREQERAAITDPVTGLANHRAFVQRLDEEIAYSEQTQKRFFLFFLDLDHFKEINDTWGHLAGDAVLAEVARRLERESRPGDFVARYGGEEFALIMTDKTVDDACEEAGRLRRIVNLDSYEWQCPSGINRASIFVTVSIGVAIYGLHGTQREELLEKADLAMYQAKLAGRDCVRVAGSQVSRPVGTFDTRHCERVASLVGDDARQKQNFIQVLQALDAVIHICDAPVGAHSNRVIKLAEATGRLLDASREELFLICAGGLLHDLGKLGIPDEVLNKPGPLNEDEWQIMCKHPILGARILEETGGFFHHLAPVVLAHHERWDGLGYPQGLKELEIPLAARVLAVVDAYDTMTSRRPYKDPISPAAAEAEIQRESGKQFDPAVVKAFLAVSKEPEPGRICLYTDARQALLPPQNQTHPLRLVR